MSSNGKPTLGFETRRQAVEALFKSGLGNHEIAKELGITVKNVRAVLWQNDNPQCDSGRFHRRVEGRAVKIPKQTYAQLQPYAVARDTTVADLIRLLVSEVATANLVDAVLDDNRMQAAE